MRGAQAEDFEAFIEMLKPVKASHEENIELLNKPL